MKRKSKKHKFPPVIYLQHNGSDDDESYLSLDTTPKEACANDIESDALPQAGQRVAVYKLMRIVKFTRHEPVIDEEATK